MKSLYESRDHQKILKQRIKDQDHARSLLKQDHWPVQDFISDWAIRVLTNDLIGQERKQRREKAWVVKKLKIRQQVTEIIEIPQEAKRQPITTEAIKEWLGQLWNIDIREERSKAGLDFLASIQGCALVGRTHTVEIPGETAEAAIRNYFTAAVNVAFIEWPKWERYIWHNRDLQFMKKEEEVYTHQPSKIKRKLMLTRRKARKVKWK